MGALTGPVAGMAQHIFGNLNQAFSQPRIGRTRDELKTWLKAEFRRSKSQPAPTAAELKADLTPDEADWAIAEGKFYEFMEFMEWVHPAQQGDSGRHLRQMFECGAYDIIGHAVISNLFHRYAILDRKLGQSAPKLEDFIPEASDFDLNDPDVVAIKNLKRYLEDFFPRPMTFERRFGEREEIVVRSNDYGIKIIVQTIDDEDRIAYRRTARLLFGRDVGYLTPDQRLVIETYLSSRSEAQRSGAKQDEDRKLKQKYDAIEKKFPGSGGSG